MKKVSSQIIVAAVCCILGFMLAYQFKALTKYQNKLTNTQSATDITAEIDMYKKEKVEMQKNIDELQAQIKKYEDAAASSSESSKEILNELDDSRMLTGSTDVQGPGVNVYIKPNANDLLGNNISIKKISDQEIVLLINELRYAGAEAISINGYRITGRTGIKISGGNNPFISLDGQQKVNQDEQITISAIGNKELLFGILNFKGELNFIQADCDISIEKSDNIKIGKSNMPIKLEYAKPVK